MTTPHLSPERLKQIRANLDAGYKTGNGDTAELLAEVERCHTEIAEMREMMSHMTYDPFAYSAHRGGGP